MTLYSPKIDQELIPKLYGISKEKGKPMTKIVNEILRQAVENEEGINKETGGSSLAEKQNHQSPGR